MALGTPLRTGAGAALLLALAVVALLAAQAHRGTAPHRQAAPCARGRTLLVAGGPSALHVVRTEGRLRARRPAYGWPVKPFDLQHPVRGFLNDPRIGRRGARAFHFGIDIAVPDGTPVYAVASGTVHLRLGSLAVQNGSSLTFGYWHVVPAVAQHQLVRRHQLLGHVATGWGHVHLAERRDGVYVNPLRPGGLGPYTDRLAPSVGTISLVATRGRVEILTTAYDTTWPPVPGAWSGEPVAPALLRWRITRMGGRVHRWRTAADFRRGMLDARRFPAIYAPTTTQNRRGASGLYCFYLARAWKPADGSYRIDVSASDTRENRAVASLDITVGHGRAATRRNVLGRVQRAARAVAVSAP
jgi:hypothetical protein